MQVALVTGMIHIKYFVDQFLQLYTVYSVFVF